MRCVVKSTAVANTRSWSIIVEKLQGNSYGVISDAFLLIKARSFGQRSGHPCHPNSLPPFDPALDAPDLFNHILLEPAPPDSLYLSRLLLSFFLPSLASAPNPVSQIY